MSLWNWKSAVVSSLGRAAMFFAINLPAGRAAAVAAWKVEFMYRLVAAGFYGALTERFSRVKPERVATVAAIVVVPAIAHAVEFIVHSYAGTAKLAPSILGSVVVSVLTTRFNLFAMRRGLLVSKGRSLLRDVIDLARLSVRAGVQFARTLGDVARKRLAELVWA